ncbi:MAG: 23S rRNA (adenine(2503)-C(2))-methyltransferase RlmN, partial [Syntrophothermus sp.]
ARSYGEMTNLPAELRQRLAGAVPLSTLALVSEAKADDGTVKCLFHTGDGRPLEAVLMRFRDGRRSVCVSSQSGCPLTCTFCATGRMAFGRNLSADEILDQALHFRRVEPIDHLVFMGMGEPTMNVDAVLAACELLPDLGVTHRRTAISTVGWVPGIDRLAECEMPIGLALSLHAPNDGLRSQLMPVNDRYPLGEVLAACDRYRAARRRRVFVEYVMLNEVNDLPEHARELAALLDRRGYKVNLIPYNPTGAYEGSPPERIERFRAILAESGLTATVRLTRGREIAAACGQLAATA